MFIILKTEFSNVSLNLLETYSEVTKKLDSKSIQLKIALYKREKRWNYFFI